MFLLLSSDVCPSAIIVSLSIMSYNEPNKENYDTV